LKTKLVKPGEDLDVSHTKAFPSQDSKAYAERNRNADLRNKVDLVHAQKELEDTVNERAYYEERSLKAKLAKPGQDVDVSLTKVLPRVDVRKHEMTSTVRLLCNEEFGHIRGVLEEKTNEQARPMERSLIASFSRTRESELPHSTENIGIDRSEWSNIDDIARLVDICDDTSCERLNEDIDEETNLEMETSNIPPAEHTTGKHAQRPTSYMRASIKKWKDAWKMKKVSGQRSSKCAETQRGNSDTLSSLVTQSSESGGFVTHTAVSPHAPKGSSHIKQTSPVIRYLSDETEKLLKRRARKLKHSFQHDDLITTDDLKSSSVSQQNDLVGFKMSETTGYVFKFDEKSIKEILMPTNESNVAVEQSYSGVSEVKAVTMPRDDVEQFRSTNAKPPVMKLKVKAQSDESTLPQADFMSAQTASLTDNDSGSLSQDWSIGKLSDKEEEAEFVFQSTNSARKEWCFSAHQFLSVTENLSSFGAQEENENGSMLITCKEEFRGDHIDEGMETERTLQQRFEFSSDIVVNNRISIEKPVIKKTRRNDKQEFEDAKPSKYTESTELETIDRLSEQVFNLDEQRSSVNDDVVKRSEEALTVENVGLRSEKYTAGMSAERVAKTLTRVEDQSIGKETVDEDESEEQSTERALGMIKNKKRLDVSLSDERRRRPSVSKPDASRVSNELENEERQRITLLLGEERKDPSVAVPDKCAFSCIPSTKTTTKKKKNIPKALTIPDRINSRFGDPSVLLSETNVSANITAQESSVEIVSPLKRPHSVSIFMRVNSATEKESFTFKKTSPISKRGLEEVSAWEQKQCQIGTNLPTNSNVETEGEKRKPSVKCKAASQLAILGKMKECIKIPERENSLQRVEDSATKHDNKVCKEGANEANEQITVKEMKKVDPVTHFNTKDSDEKVEQSVFEKPSDLNVTDSDRSNSRNTGQNTLKRLEPLSPESVISDGKEEDSRKRTSRISSQKEGNKVITVRTKFSGKNEACNSEKRFGRIDPEPFEVSEVFQNVSGDKGVSENIKESHSKRDVGEEQTGRTDVQMDDILEEMQIVESTKRLCAESNDEISTYDVTEIAIINKYETATIERSEFSEYVTSMNGVEKKMDSRYVLKEKTLAKTPVAIKSRYSKHEKLMKESSQEEKIITFETKECKQSSKSTAKETALLIQAEEVTSKLCLSSISNTHIRKAKLTRAEKLPDTPAVKENRSVVCTSTLEEISGHHYKTPPTAKTDVVNDLCNQELFATDKDSRSSVDINEPLKDGDQQNTELIADDRSSDDVALTKRLGVESISEMTKNFEGKPNDQETGLATELCEQSQVPPTTARNESRSVDSTLNSKPKTKKPKLTAVIRSDVVFLSSAQSFTTATTVLQKRDDESKSVVEVVVPTSKARAYDDDTVPSSANLEWKVGEDKSDENAKLNVAVPNAPNVSRAWKKARKLIEKNENLSSHNEVCPELFISEANASSCGLCSQILSNAVRAASDDQSVAAVDKSCTLSWKPLMDERKRCIFDYSILNNDNKQMKTWSFVVESTDVSCTLETSVGTSDCHFRLFMNDEGGIEHKSLSSNLDLTSDVISQTEGKFIAISSSDTTTVLTKSVPMKDTYLVEIKEISFGKWHDGGTDDFVSSLSVTKIKEDNVEYYKTILQNIIDVSGQTFLINVNHPLPEIIQADRYARALVYGENGTVKLHLSLSGVN
uniref:ANK_REP_REGION domain-containing protein n=1 Tax=Angiostrongylus cantonensis TaxID=6313 RepID=A0A0K0CZR3_ANGCA